LLCAEQLQFIEERLIVVLPQWGHIFSYFSSPHWGMSIGIAPYQLHNYDSEQHLQPYLHSVGMWAYKFSSNVITRGVTLKV